METRDRESNVMPDQSVAHWAVHVDSIAAAAKKSQKAVAFLHLAKTGGSTIENHFSISPGWTKLRLPSSFGDPNGCECGGADCPHDLEKLGIPQLRENSCNSLFLKFLHERYETVRWMLDELARAGGPFELVTTVRPVRQRIVSMFTDYWTQVFTADRYHAGEIDLSPHRLNVVSNYFLDSNHYRQGRVIDGEAWFRSFSVHGAGVPFLLSEVFGDSPDGFHRVLDSGVLRVVPTSQLDDFLFDLTGEMITERVRTSVSLASPLTNALMNAETLIDQLVEKEAPFDQVLADHLGDPNFMP